MTDQETLDKTMNCIKKKKRIEQIRKQLQQLPKDSPEYHRLHAEVTQMNTKYREDC